METPINAETISKFIVVMETQGVGTAVRTLESAKRSLYIDQKRLVKPIQAFNYELSAAAKHGAQHFGAVLKNISNVSRALKENVGISAATTKGLNNLGQGVKTYTSNANNMLTRGQKLRVMSDTLKIGMTDLGMQFQNAGKQAQWAGRQMIVGLSLPLATGAMYAVKQWNKVEEQITRVQKVMSNKDFKGLGGQEGVINIARKLGHEYGVVDEMVVALMGDYAAMGYTSKKTLKEITDLTLKIALLGDVDISEASDAVRVITDVFAGGEVKKASEILDTFNAIENTTAINMKELIPAFPEAAQNAKQFGMSAEDLAASLAVMYKKGFAVTESAHAIKFALASLTRPTREASDEILSLQEEMPNVGNVFASVASGALRGRGAIEAMSVAYTELNKVNPKRAGDLLSMLVGKRQTGRISGLFEGVAQGVKELNDKKNQPNPKYVSDWARSISVQGKKAQNAYKAMSEVQKKQASDSFKYQQAMRDFKSSVAQIGQSLSPIFAEALKKIGNGIKKFTDALDKSPAMKKFVIGTLAAVAALGPLVSIFGIFKVAAGSVLKGLAKFIFGLGYSTKEIALMEMATGKANGRFLIIGDTVKDTRGKFKQYLAQGKKIVQNMLGMASSTAEATTASSGETAALTAEEMAVEALTKAIKENTIAMAANAAAKEANAAASGVAAAADDVMAGMIDTPANEIDAALADLGNLRKKQDKVPGWGGKWPTTLEKEAAAKQAKLDAADLLGLDGIDALGPDDFNVIDDAAEAMAEHAAEAADDVVDAMPKRNIFAKMFGLSEGMESKIKKMFSPIKKGIDGLLTKVPEGGILSKILGMGGAGAAGAEGGAATGLLASIGSSIVAIAGTVGIIAGVAAVIVGLIFLLAKLSGHWKQFWSGVKEGVKPAMGILKSAFNSLKSAGKALWEGLKAVLKPIIDLFTDLGKIMSGNAKGGKKADGSGWKSIGKVMGFLGTALAGVAKAFAWVIEWVAKFLGFIMKVIGVVLKLAIIFNPFIWILKLVVTVITAVITAFSDFNKAIKILINGIASIVNPIIKIFNKLLRVVQKVYSKLLSVVIKMAKMIHSIPIFGDNMMPQSVIDGLEAVQNKLDNNPLQIPLVPTYDTSDPTASREGDKAGKDTKKAAQSALDKEPLRFKQVLVDDEAAQEAAQKWVDAFKSRLDAAMQKLRDQAMKNFEDMVTANMKAFEADAMARLKVYDDQVAAIEAVEKAEQELYETQQYLAERRKMLDDYALTTENYKRDRALAIYEGRYDDAAMLDAQYLADSRDFNTSLETLDADRARTLLQQQRDAQKEQLSAQKEALQQQIDAQKEAMQQQYDIQRESLQAQLDSIIEYTPRSVGAVASMIDQMNALLSGVGAESMGIAMDIATNEWTKATDQAGADVAEAAYWAGLGAAIAAKKGMEIETEEWKTWFKGLTDVDRKTYLAREAAASGIPFVPDSIKGQSGAHHTGGPIKSDEFLATLQQGEYVIRKSAVEKLGVPYLDMLNAPKFHTGGLVGQSISTMMDSLLMNEFDGFFHNTSPFGGYTWESLKQKYRTMPSGSGMGMPTGQILLDQMGQFLVTGLQKLLAQAFPDLERNILNGSLYRPDSTGSFHATGQALDIGDAGTTTARLMDVFTYLKANLDRFDIIELIFQHEMWKYRQPQYYSPSDHFDHVHVAVGSALSGLVPMANGGRVLMDTLPALLHKDELVVPARAVENFQASMAGGKPAHQQSDVYISVDTFVGQKEWFEEMVKEYNVKTLPFEQRKRGTINRTISSRKDNTVRYV